MRATVSVTSSWVSCSGACLGYLVERMSRAGQRRCGAALLRAAVHALEGCLGARRWRLPGRRLARMRTC
jgi:hypothetical protein